MSYGCYNRKPFTPGQWLYGVDSSTGRNMVTYVRNRMAPNCQYQINDKYNDPGCRGCIHNLKEKKQ